jgi:hypothetical protein
MRWRMLEALARRMEGQSEPVRALLQARLAAGLDACEQGIAGAPVTSARPAPAPRVADPLAALNLALREAAASRAGPGDEAPANELASARRFRQAWHAQRTLEQVEQALGRRPANAGPLNSHALVLQSIALMRQLSPAYLGRFLAAVESLQWLELARAPQAVQRPAKPARARRRGRPGDI